MNKISQIKLLVFVTLALCLNSLECAKILAVFPYAGRSQYLCVEEYLRSLAARGHEVTSLSLYPQKTSINNFRDIILKMEKAPHDDLIKAAAHIKHEDKLAEMRGCLKYSSRATLLVLKNEEFQQLLRSDAHFDLIIVEVFFLESLYALGHHFKAPLIGVSSFGTDVLIDQLIDNTSPVSYVPSPSSQNWDGMNYWQRLNNLYFSTMQLIYHHLVIIPQQQRYYEEFFPNATLRLSEARRDFSLILLNQHYSISWTRPYVPNAIEVGGWHINPKVNKLPADMEAFINSSPNGVIYFSLGSNMKSAFLSKDMLADLMGVFASLPINVLWKYEKTDLPNKPKNVYISKWFPQTDLLAHPKVKLFVTHGGIHSCIEAVHYGKPIVGMPVFYDQHLNVARCMAKGFGLVVDFRAFKSEELRSAILEVLNNPKYAEKAKEISARYHDRPMTALDTAIYWTEYVLRHKGAPHLRVAARQLNFFQRNSIDTKAVLFGLPLLILLLIIVGIFKLSKLIFSGGVKNKRKRE